MTRRACALYEKPADHGSLLVVDQLATIGVLVVAVAQDVGITVGYLPGLSMRRIADLMPGSARTDARDAAVIAGAVRTMPHTLRSVSTSDEDAAALSMLTGFDLDLARRVDPTGAASGACGSPQTPPRPGDRGGGPGRVHDAAGEARRRLAHPHRPEKGRPGTNRCQAQEVRVQAARHLGRLDRLGSGAPECHRRWH